MIVWAFLASAIGRYWSFWGILGPEGNEQLLVMDSSGKTLTVIEEKTRMMTADFFHAPR